MPRTIEDENLQKHTLHLYKGDFEKLGTFYNTRQVTPSVAVRRIVRAHLLALEAKLSAIPSIDTGATDD